MRKFLSTILLMAFALGASPAIAQQKFENLDRIDSLVAMTVGANQGEPGGPQAPVDRRLRLAACPKTPSVTGPVFGAAVVSCDALGWRIRVALVPGTSAAAGPPVRQAIVRPVTKEVVVKKGDPVQLVAGGRLFSVSRMMVSDEDGAMGQMIRVREDKKSPTVLAQVVEMGMVRIPVFNEN